ncbi:MAG: class I SAM-dependent RNA methyltransferase [Proteobacteria bacterium]|nr:class I SAM-dependent RNA methyltransferase [Pseudomonadota bacterium]MBU4295241.1 class I SAM-dependent RNA methyltransferase [Pseudomonadota bacterium]MCG2750175.1 THUMP domain-containing protein [Desulfobulbaceae bacterium]
MFTYQKTNRYFAQIARGLEQYGAEELANLGCQDVKPMFMGIYFDADPADLYRANYMSRLCTRILAPLLTFDCHSTKYLYKTARKIDWNELLSEKNTFAINASVTGSSIKHSQYAALCLKDAIVDHFRDLTGIRPDVDTENPDLWFHLRIERNRAIISLDTSGGSLHRRGYRQMSVEAPMQETVAAAIIRLSNWDGVTPLIDPMCGSGTILTEALMHCCQIPAAYLRKKFGFEMMPEYDKTLWNQVRTEANNLITRLPGGLLSGSDASAEAVKAALHNCRMLPHGDKIIIKNKRYQESSPTRESIIITNPPYGLRLKQNEGAERFMRELGDFLKKQKHCTAAYLYLGRPELLKELALRPAWQKPLLTGGLEGVLVKFDLA